METAQKGIDAGKTFLGFKGLYQVVVGPVWNACNLSASADDVDKIRIGMGRSPRRVFTPCRPFPGNRR